VHGLAVALFGGGAIVITGCGEVFLHAGAFFVEGPEAEHRRRKPAFGSAVQPARSLFAVLRNAAAVGKPHANFVFGRGLAGECRCAQRGTADRRWQLIGERSGRRRGHRRRRWCRRGIRRHRRKLQHAGKVRNWR
jgi:hypothetical protein